MALTNLAIDLSNGMPSAALRSVNVSVDLDNSYPNPGGGVVGGYTLLALADADGDTVSGQTVKMSPWVPQYDGAALRWFRLINDAGNPKLQAFTTANGAPNAEVANAVDLSGHTGLEVEAIIE